MKYLDLTGLQKFWAKVKNLVQTNLEGYAKTSDIPADYTVISLSADSGTLTTDQLSKLKANPHKTVLKRSGYCYFVEDLSSSTIYKYSRNIYHSNNKLFKQVISITTSSGAYTKTELDYTYTHPTTHPASMITGLANVAKSGSYNDLSYKPNIPSIEGLASETYVNDKIDALVNDAPEALDTLKELSKALGDDKDFAATVTTKIGNLQTAVDGKAALSHGNHVPATETADNAKFLRNDNTWQTVTPANIGAAAASHGTHVTYATATPSANGTAKVGTSAKVAREDHVHPLQTTVSGNAGTATKLATARTIALNGDVTGSVSFNGSADVMITATVTDDSHNHVIANVDGLQDVLNGKQPSGNYVTTDTTQTISANKTYTGQQTFSNGKFAIKANSANDDSWINLTNSTNGAYYAFGIRRPYGSYGLQMKYHPDSSNQDTSRPGAANGTSDIYYDIYHQGNYTKIPAATTSANGLMSSTDKTKLNGLPTFSFDPTTGTLTITSS